MSTEKEQSTTLKERLVSWAVPTVLTGIIALLASGVQISLRTNQQNTEVLLKELGAARQEIVRVTKKNQELNDQLYNRRNQKE